MIMIYWAILNIFAQKFGKIINWMGAAFIFLNAQTQIMCFPKKKKKKKENFEIMSHFF